MNNLENVAGTRCLMHAALIAGTTTTLTTTGVTHYSIKGKTYTKAAMTNAANATTDANTGAAFSLTPLAVNKGTVYVVGLNAAGTNLVAQGSVVDLDAVGGFIIAPQFPPIPDTMCPIGYVTAANGPTGSAWTWGTSNWTATGLVDVFVSVSELPPRPQIA
jgi:hypothetical protein